MPWFWGSKKQQHDEESYSDSDYDDDYSESEESYEEDLQEQGESGSHQEEDDDVDENIDIVLDINDENNNDETDVNEAIQTSLHRVSSHTVSSDGDASLIESDGLHSDEEDYLDSAEDDPDDESDDDNVEEEIVPPQVEEDDSSEDEEDVDGSEPSSASSQKMQQPRTVVQVETVNEDSDDDDDDDDDDEDSPQDEVTSIWEKQSLLVLAAEHDRVDILKAILTEEDEDREALLCSGIPPLHIAISFGSTNCTQSLLRMGADPSIRPLVARVKEQQKEAPEGTKLEIPNMARFDNVTAWELAFGNQAYQTQGKRRTSWSVFKNSNSFSDSAKRFGDQPVVIAPVDLPPSKQEGIRHAFTAEALRCIGADEVDRLQQLLQSGMPPTIEIGGKDLYDWAVQLGGLKCEELLRPAEAAKHGDETFAEDATKTGTETVASSDDKPSGAPSEAPETKGKVLDRAKPGDENSVSSLANRLDELESLASALSKCLDNLAEEVSVCHGLLLMGGGAAALAAHVKSLKNLQQQKRDQLEEAQKEWETSEAELEDLMRSSGEIGADVAKLDPSAFLENRGYSRAESLLREAENQDEDHLRQQLLAQIAASESNIIKLRASITDLSEESAREMEEVERRGLSGGIQLVRNLRDELREIEFQLAEVRSMQVACRAKIGAIHSRIPAKPKSSPPVVTAASVKSMGNTSEREVSPEASDSNDLKALESTEATLLEDQSETETEDVGEVAPKPVPGNAFKVQDKVEKDSPQPMDDEKKEATSSEIPAKSQQETPEISNMERIATGDSQALALRPSGNHGYFTVDLWQVLLRIMGFHAASTRRGATVSKKNKNLMIV
eukprot:Nitzschia sp. Nitz4//scaffold73_size107353//28172//30694//NITZ4_004310-RA/size107353-processed-gene-0.163-mRNA-1//1//CDS//3329557446//3002//frame0